MLEGNKRKKKLPEEKRNSFQSRAHTHTHTQTQAPPVDRMKNSIVRPFSYMITRKYNLFLLLSDCGDVHFSKSAAQQDFMWLVPIVMQKPFHKVRMEAKRSHRDTMYIHSVVPCILRRVFPIDKLD